MDAFHVLTEFRFDVASAVASSQTLQTEVGRISTAADNAHYALQRIGVGLVAQMGLGTGGFLGAIYTALKVSDKYAATQRSFANIFLSNGAFRGAGAFEDSMTASADALDRMKSVARQFSLPVGDLVDLTKTVGASLFSAHLDDTSLGKSTMLSRGYLKSASTLGIDPANSKYQLLDLVNGRANMHETLFQRLMNETTSMAPFRGQGGTQRFNALQPAKRLDVLTKSLMQFGSVTEIVNLNALSMSGQLQRLSDNFLGIFSVLKPIGDALMGPVKMILLKVNQWLETSGEKAAKSMSKIIESIFKDPEKLFVNIQQARRLQGDLSRAGKTFEFMMIVELLTGALRFLGFELKGGLVMVGLRSFGTALSWLGGWFMRLGGFTLLWRALLFIVKDLFAPLALLTFFFQALSRGMAKAEVINAKWLLGNTDKIADLMSRFKRGFDLFVLPITLAIESISDVIAWIFRLDISGGILLSFFGFLDDQLMEFGKAMLGLLSIVSGVIRAILGLIVDLNNAFYTGNFTGIWDNIGKNFNEGSAEFWKKYAPKEDGGERGVSTKVTNIGTIMIQNQFKEQMEPDRIAYILKEKLIDAALNPQQANRRSLRANAVGN